jgi:hypothetical protein
VLEMDGRRFLVDDQYCARPHCGCTQSFIGLVPEGQPGRDTEEKLPPTLEVDYRSGRWRPVRQGGEGGTLLGRFVYGSTWSRCATSLAA